MFGTLRPMVGRQGALVVMIGALVRFVSEVILGTIRNLVEGEWKVSWDILWRDKGDSNMPVIALLSASLKNHVLLVAIVLMVVLVRVVQVVMWKG